MEAITSLLLIMNGILLGTGMGFIMHRSDFCLAGMFRDLFLFRQTAMLRFLFLLVSLSAVLFETARLTGLLPIYPFTSFGPPSAANFIGGLLFGIGMVLAGGCAVGTLYKLGAGSFLSFLALIGLIVGNAAYAEIHPFWGSFSKATPFGKGVTVPQTLGIDPLPLMLAFLAVSCYLCLRWYRAGNLLRVSPTASYIQPYKASMILALIGLCAVLVTGKPLGVTTAYAKMGAYIESAVLSDHYQALLLTKAKPQVYINPVTKAHLAWSAGPVFDAVSLIQFSLIFGIIAGGAISALLLREFRIYWKVPPRQYSSAVIGGIIMGVASRMAPGCNVVHLLGGVPILAWQSLLFVTGILPGAWLGSKLLVKLVLK